MASNYLRQLADFYKDLRGSSSRSFKLLLGAATALHVLGALMPSSRSMFAVSPAQFIGSGRIWTLVTAGFFETTPIMGFVNLLILFSAGPYFSTKWGDKSLLRFILTVSACVYASTFILLVSLFTITGFESFYFAYSCGLTGTSAAIVVALKQAFGERALAPFPVLDAVKVKHLPIITAGLSLAVWFVAGYGKELPLMMGGTFFAWFYLRFFRVDSETQVVGDPREEFTFATLFPSPMQPFVSALSVLVLRLAIGLGFFKQATSEANRVLAAATASVQSFDGLTAVTVDNGAVGTESAAAAAERRRALAIKAIDAKLAALSVPLIKLPVSVEQTVSATSPADSTQTGGSATVSAPAVSTPVTAAPAESS